MRLPTSILLLLLSGSLVLAGLSAARYDKQLADSLKRADGQIVSYRDFTTGNGRRQRTSYFPRVQFIASNGKEYTFESRVAEGGMIYTIGQHVTVLYSEASGTPAKDAEIEGAGLSMPYAIYYLAFGVGLVGLIGAFRSRRVA